MTTEAVEHTRSHWPISILSSVASLVNLFMPLVLVRYLSAEEVGLFKIFFLYLTMVPAFSLVSGFLDGIAYWSGQPRERRRVALKMSATIMFSAGFLFSLLAVLLHGPASDWLGWPPLHTLLFAISLFGAIAGMYLEEAVIAQGRIWFGALFYSGFEILRAVLIVAAVLISPSVTTVLIVHCIVSVSKTILSLILGGKIGLIGFEWDSQVFREAVKYAMPVSGAWVFGVFVTHADQFILSFYIPPEEFAYYTIGCLLVPPLFIIEHSICRVMIPQLSEAFAAGRQERGSRLYREASENIAFLIVPAVTGLFVFAVPIIELLFTRTYASAAEYLQIFCFSYLVIIVPFDALARSRAVSGWLFKSFVFFSIFSLSLTLILIVPFGAFGALAALLMVRFSMRLYAIHYIQKSTGWSLKETLPLFPLFQFVTVSVLLGLCCELVRSSFSNDLTWFFVAGGSFAVAYFFIFALWKVRRYTGEEYGKRILMLLPTLGIGGMERMVLQLASALSEKEFKVYTFAFDCDPTSQYPDLHSEFLKAQIPVEKYGKVNKKFFAIGAIWKIVRYINAYDIQVIHSHNLGSLMHAVLARFVSLHPVRIVHTQHSFVHLKEHSRYALYEKFFSRFASVLVSVSEDTRAQYRALGLPEKNLAYIPNGISLPQGPLVHFEQKRAQRLAFIDSGLVPESMQAKMKSAKDSIWVLSLARIDSIKGQMRLLTFWRNLSEEIREKMYLLFVGPEAEPGFFKKFFPEIEAMPNSERIIYCGATTNPSSWYEHCDLYISGSSFEGMPLGPLEALAHGLPCLLTDIPGHRFLEDRAQYFSLTDPKDGAAQLSELLQEMGTHSLTTRMEEIASGVVEGFGIQQMAERYARIFTGD